MPRKFIVFMLAFCFIVSTLCGIFYVASQAEVQLTPMGEMSEKSNVWIHAGDHFLWTIAEE